MQRITIVSYNLLEKLTIYFNWRFKDSQKKIVRETVLRNLGQLGVLKKCFSGNVVKGVSSESSVINI